METGRQSILRNPIILLALFNLIILMVRLWPWQNVMSLPGNGATGFDPAISLLAYMGLGFWIGTAREEDSRKALFSAAWLGALAGLFLVAHVVIAARVAGDDPATGLDPIQIAVMAAAALVIGFAGLRTARAGFTNGFSALCATWASIVACLMGVTAVLAEIYLSPAQSESSNPWKDYQALAIGTPAMQSLVHSLDTIAGFLLLGPVVGCIVGALFASFAKPRKP